MQLHSLTVSGLRCFRNPVTLTEFDHRINIISGPNELGKSTLVWGLILAFCNRHDVGGEGILAYRPWGTDLSPVIEVEFAAAGKRYRLEKGFLDQAKCVLSEQAGEGYLRLADGKRADDRVREFMLARFPGRGLAKGADWGLAHLLWMPQDKERFTSPSVSRQVEDHFQQAAGATIFTSQDDRLLQLVDDRYAKIYTPKTAVYQTGSEIRQTEARQHELDKKLEEARRQLAKITGQATELERREKQAQAAEETVRQLTEEHKKLLARVDEVKKLKGRIETVDAQVKAALQRWRLLKQDFDHVETWGRKSNDAARAVQDKEKELVSVRPLVQKLQEQVAIKEREITQLTAGLKAANRQLSRVYKTRQSLTLLQKIDKIKHDCTAARKIEQELAGFKTGLSLKPVPTAKQLADAEQLQRQIEISQGQAKAQGLRIDFRPTGDFEVTVKTAEGQAEHSVGPGRPLAVDVTGAEVQLEIATVGTFSIASGASELKGILTRLKADKKKLAAILTTFTVGNAAELRERYDWAQSSRRQIEQLQAEQANILGEHDSMAELEQEGIHEQQQLERLCEELGLDVSHLSSISPVDAAELERQARALEERQEKGQKELGALREEWRKKEDRQRTLEQEISELKQMLRTAAEEQEKRLANYQGEKDELERSLRGAQDEKEQQLNLLSQLKDRLPPDADSLERTALRLEQDIGRKQEQGTKLREEMAGLRAEINLQSEVGLYSKISRLEEEYELVQREYNRLEVNARAVKLLYRLVHARHEAMLADITDPIRQGLNSLFQQVTFRRDRSLQLEADLSLAGLRVENEESLQPLEAFSIGTQEQMLLLARLALAQFLSTGERQLVVLDDALVNSDGTRRSRILDLLADAAADRFQLLILTCHPDMYKELPGKRYDLASLLIPTGSGVN